VSYFFGLILVKKARLEETVTIRVDDVQWFDWRLLNPP
jgi:hypothetical protein